MQKGKKKKAPSVVATTSVPAVVPAVDTRVTEILDLMSSGQWVRGVTAGQLAAKWGIPLSTVENSSAEAWRTWKRLSNDADKMRPEVAAVLHERLQYSNARRNVREVVAIADVFTRVIGARAAERHEHAVVIAQFESLPPKGKIEWIDERIAKLTEARAVVLEEMNAIDG